MEVTKTKKGCNNNNCLQGRQPDMLFLLQEKLNFTFTIKVEPVVGVELSNGSWSGMIG